MEELTKRVEELDKKVMHLEAMLSFKQEIANKFCTHSYPIPGISKGSLSPTATKTF